MNLLHHFVLFLAINSDIDMIYLIDSSDGVSTETFNAFKSFVAKDVKTKDFESGKIRVGILNYASDAVLQLSPKNGISETIVNNVLSKMGRINGKRNFKLTFQYILDAIVKNPLFVRKNSKRLLALLVDGRSLSWTDSDAALFKEKFENAGVDLLIITMDKNVKEDLKGLVPNPDNILVVDETDKLPDTSTNITDVIGKITGMLFSLRYKSCVNV